MAGRLNRSLSRTQLIFYGVGTMVGAGIYSVIGTAAGIAGTNLWISFILAGIVAFLTVLSYAELTSALHKAGAEYQFMKAAFPHRKLPAFLAGYLIILNASATSATVALAFAGYLKVFIDIPLFVSAFSLLLICTLINIAGIRQATWVSMALICVEVSGLLLMIAAGFSSGNLEQSFTSFPKMEDVSGIFTTTAIIFFIYIGFEDIANLSEESRSPTKHIPKALLISLLITSILYILVAISVIAVSTPQQLAGSDSPLTLAAGSVSPWIGKFLAVAALFATSSTALISLISISRMLFGMAREGDMPKIFGRILEKRQTPWIAALALFVASCLLLLLGQVKIVASISSFGVLLVFIGVHVAMITLRYRQPELKRDFKVPFSIGRAPILPFFGILLSLALLTQFEPIVYFVGGGIIIFGIVTYFIQEYRRHI